MVVGTSPLLLGFRWRPESAAKFVSTPMMVVRFVGCADVKMIAVCKL
jgi:hypothetical protein